jgi:hypothetical protein
MTARSRRGADPEPLVSRIGACTLACAMLPSREDCDEDCEAARDAAARAAHLLERTDASDVHWVVEYWLPAGPERCAWLQPVPTPVAGCQWRSGRHGGGP